MDVREKLRRFAHHFAKHNLKDHHYDNCRVEFSAAHAYGLTYQYLLKGYSIQQIEGAYYHALIRLHQLAVDQGLNTVVPSGLIADARRRLGKNKPAVELYDPKGVLDSRKRRFSRESNAKETTEKSNPPS